jgi:hypothetical protein
MIQGSGVPTSTSSLYVLQFCKSRTSTSEYVHRVKVEARADPAGIGLAATEGAIVRAEYSTYVFKCCQRRRQRKNGTEQGPHARRTFFGPQCDERITLSTV